MERADLLYSGLLLAAGMLSVWTALLLTATLVALAPSLRKSAPTAATISYTRPHGPTHHGAEEPTPPRSLPEALPRRCRLVRTLRLIQSRNLASLSASPAPRRQRPSLRSNPPETSHLLPARHRHRAGQGNLPVPDALGGHRHLPRYRVRSAQRPLRPPRAPLLLLLPAQPHRRHHGPRHQRPQRRPDAARPGHHVLG